MTIDKHYPSAYTFGGIDISFPFPLDSVKSLEYKFLDPLELGWKSGKEGKEEEEKRKKKKTIETALFTGTMSGIHPRERYSLENRRRLLGLLSRATSSPRIGHFLYYIPYFLSTKPS